MAEWRNAYRDHRGLYALLQERDAGGRYVNPTMSSPGALNEFGERYFAGELRQREALDDMLSAILASE